MHEALISRLHDLRDQLAPSAIAGTSLNGHAVRELIGTLIACAAALDDRVGLTIDLDKSDYTSRQGAGHH